jgi:hypothetical protein
VHEVPILVLRFLAYPLVRGSKSHQINHYGENIREYLGFPRSTVQLAADSDRILEALVFGYEYRSSPEAETADH